MGFVERVKDFFLMSGNIPALVLNRIVDSTGWNMLETIWQPYVLSLGASMPILGAFDSVYTALISVFQLGTGELSDSIGRKKLMVFSYFLSLIGIVITLLAGSWMVLIPVIILYAVGDALLEPAISPMFAESVEETQRGTAFSLLSLTWFLPGFYSYIIAGYLAERFGNLLVIRILLATEIVSFLIFVVFVKETLAETKAVDFRRILENFLGLLKPRRGLGTFYALVILDRFAWALSGGIFVGMLWRSFGLSHMQIGILLNTFSVVTAFSLIPMGKLVDRHGSRRPLILSAVLSCMLFIGYFFSRDYQFLLLVQIIRGLAIAVWDPASNAYLLNAVPEDERGAFFGNLHGLKGLLAFPAPIIGALLFEAYGFHGTVLASFLLSLLALAVSFKIRKLE